MFFNSIEFLLFLPMVLIIYYILPVKVRHYWLLASSYYFYMCWNAKYAVLIFASTLITYLSGLALDRAKMSKCEEAKTRVRKKIIVAISFISNLSILFYFKYFNFVIESMCKTFRFAHINLNIPSFDILLPVGISFYTFQALSYTMDVYRDEIYAERDFLDMPCLYLFFRNLLRDQ